MDVRIAHINNYINKEFNKKYGTHLVEAILEDEKEDYGYHERAPRGLQDSECKKTIVVKFIFSFSISLSIQLIILMMCELTDFAYEESRLLMFQITIALLIFFITFIQPYIIISALINHDLYPLKTQRMQIVITSTFFILWLYVLHKFGDLSKSFIPNPVTINPRSLIEIKVNEISISGITTLAILSGIGSTSTPYRLFGFSSAISNIISGKRNKYKSKEISELDINNNIQSLNHTNSLLSKRIKELNKLQSINGGTIYNHLNPSYDSVLYKNAGSNRQKVDSLLHKVQSFASFSGFSKSNVEEKELEEEINSLRLVLQGVFDDLLKNLSRFDTNMKRISNSNKIRNIITNNFNILFGLYCIYRVVNVLFIKMLLGLVKSKAPHLSEGVDNEDPESASTPTKDALAVTLSKIVMSFFTVPFSETQLINQISFILSGSLFLCSFSNVQTTLKSYGRFFPSLTKMPLFAKNWLKHVAISELLSIYVISTALLIRTNLPSNLSQQISKILSLSGSSNSNSEIAIQEVAFIDKWFDKVFALASLCTLVLLTLRDFMSSNKDNDIDEESLIEDNPAFYKTA